MKQPTTSPATMRGLPAAFMCMCVVLCGCAEMPAKVGMRPPPSFAPDTIHAPIEIGVLIAGWHSGIVLPAHELGPLRSLAQDPRAKYLSFGWGNRRFYMAAHPGSGDALAALFRSPSVLFVQAGSTPADLLGTDARIHWVCANRDELWRAEGYIEQSLSRPAGKTVDLGPGPLPDSHFYASTGHYSAVHTCNTWTIAALQYAGLPVSASGILFASQAERRLRKLHACPAQ